jgi:hypothetical protein
VLLVLLAGFSSSALATNMYETHGYDYEFDEETLFPVAWDLRGAWFEYRDYALAYLVRDAAEWADQKITEILEDALDAGINTVVIRKEGWMDAENLDSRTDAPTHYLEDRADLIRELGLNVMLGGFRDILVDVAHNQNVKYVIEDYIDGMGAPSGWGSVIGIHGFDEVDGKYDSSSGSQQAIRDSLEAYHDWSNNEIDPNGISYPLGCFMAKPALSVPSLYNPHVYTSGSYSTVYQLCNRQDYPMLDWYPCRTFEGSPAEIYLSSAEVWGATDLRSSGDYNYYQAYCTRDELWSVDYDAVHDETTFHVYKVSGEGQVGSVDFDEAWSVEVVDMDWPFNTASSDYRASDIGDRDYWEHNLNGAVVMYHPGADVDEAQIVFHDGTSLIVDNMPSTQVTEQTLFFCIGEEDYAQSPQFAYTEGIIGTAGLRVLWCGEGLDTFSDPVIRVRVFAKDVDEIIQEASLELSGDPEDFTPIGAVWGYFWDNDASPFRRSGFVLYDEDGQYVVVHQDETTGDWEADGQPYTGLFDGMIDPSVLFAYRQTTWPAEHFTPARDLLLSVVSESEEEGFYLQWRASTGSGWSLDSPSDMYFDTDIESDQIDCASFRRVWDGNKTRFWFGGDGIDLHYNIHPFSPGWEDERDATVVPPESIDTSNERWALLSLPMRSRHTRNPWVNALLYDVDGSNTEFSVRSGEITVETEGSGASYASTYLLFNNLCSRGSGYAGHDLGAYDIEFEYGISETESGGDCLFANIQAFGRYQQENATFLPSHETGIYESDTLLYMTVAPIVHGCRGISFYALDMALMCGSPGDATMPNRLLNWGPSRDGEENGDRDMVRAVHDVVGMLTGEYGGPDFLDALINHDDWNVMDSSNAVNAYVDQNEDLVAYPLEDKLNFIALVNSTHDILLIVSNDWHSEPAGSGAPLIWFPYLAGDLYNQAECWGGFGYEPEAGAMHAPERTTVSIDPGTDRESDFSRLSSSSSALVTTHPGPRSELPLVLDFSWMPPFTVSLISIAHNTESDEERGMARIEEERILGATRSTDGEIRLQVSGYRGACELVVYDLTGRIVSELYDGVLSGGGMDFTIGAGELSKGLYFVTMMQDGEIAGIQRILAY